MIHIKKRTGEVITGELQRWGAARQTEHGNLPGFIEIRVVQEKWEYLRNKETGKLEPLKLLSTHTVQRHYTPNFTVISFEETKNARRCITSIYK